MSKRVFVFAHQQARLRASAFCMEAPEGWSATFAPPNRTTDQNARLWAMLGDISRQVEWYGKKLAPEDWKHVFSASLRTLSVVPNLDGTGFVALGLSTSSMSKRELGDLMDLMEAFGAERDVKWTEPRKEEPSCARVPA
jgi:hypothetical protein